MKTERKDIEIVGPVDPAKETSDFIDAASYDAQLAEGKIRRGESCTYNGKSYSEGASICQANWEKECKGGRWVSTGYQC